MKPIDFALYILFSTILMLLLHYLYDYLKKHSTTKKVRYLGQFQNTKYQEILSELRNREKDEIKVLDNLEIIDEGSDFISSTEKDEMQQSLFNLIQISI